MASRNSLGEIKSDIDIYVGHKVRLKTNKGRKKTCIREGILERTYPSIFVVLIEGTDIANRRVSYSYSDILTETVELTICEPDKKIQCS
jgi:uncharacterized protein Veg